MEENSYDCIIIGAGPGGLQAAIHLARYNRKVLLIDQGGGRTRHALHIENYLGLEITSGKELVDTGIRQIKSFGAEFRREHVASVRAENGFTVITEKGRVPGALCHRFRRGCRASAENKGDEPIFQSNGLYLC